MSITQAEQFTNDYARGLPVVFNLYESYYNLKNSKITDMIKEFLAEYKLIEREEKRGRIKFPNQPERRREYQRNYQTKLRKKRKGGGG